MNLRVSFCIEIVLLYSNWPQLQNLCTFKHHECSLLSSGEGGGGGGK